VSQPAGVSIELVPEAGAAIAYLRGGAREVVLAELERLPEFCRDLSLGRYTVC